VSFKVQTIMSIKTGKLRLKKKNLKMYVSVEVCCKNQQYSYIFAFELNTLHQHLIDCISEKIYNRIQKEIFKLTHLVHFTCALLENSFILAIF